MKRTASILLGCVFALGQQVPTQPPEPERPGLVFSVTSTLVQLDAVVTDSKGRHVTDLAPADFEVFEDGKVQPITHFSYVQVAAPPQVTSDAKSKSRPSPRQDSKLSPPPAARLRPEEVRRTVVLMIDDLGLSFESMAYVRIALRKFIETQMEPGDLVAICRTAYGSSSLHQFTNDKRILLSIADGLRWNPSSRFGTGLFAPIGAYRSGGPGNPSGDLRSRDVALEAERSAMFTIGTLGAIEAVVGSLGELPGRKSIVLFSDGMSLAAGDDLPQMHTAAASGAVTGTAGELFQALRKLIDRANRSGTVIYTVHAAGLQTLQPDAQDNPHLGGLPNVSAEERQNAFLTMTGVGIRGGRDVLFNALQQGLGYLADETGGLAYENGNDMNWGLKRVLDDQRGYYLLGYKPLENTFQEKHGQARYHHITVRVKRPGLHVRTRTGFFGETDDDVRPRFKDAAEQMHAAMLSPFHSSGIRLRLTALYAQSPKQETMVRNLMHIDSRDVRFLSNSDGSVSAHLDLVAVASTGGDTPLATMGRSYELHIPPEQADEVLRDGALYALDIPVKKAGAYQIRVAVRDAITGRIGSASQFLEIPDLKKRPFALTSIVLDTADRLRGHFGFGIMPARRQFHQGGRIEYVSLVQGRASKAPNSALDARVRIVRDGREIYTGPAKVVDAGGTRVVTGMLQLTGAITPGEYYMQVLAEQTGSKKPAIHGQWTDFEVLP